MSQLHLAMNSSLSLFRIEYKRMHLSAINDQRHKKTAPAHPVHVRLMRRAIVCLLFVSAPALLPAQQESKAPSKTANAAATTFKSTCGVCHGADGRGGERAPNIATKREVANLSDGQLTLILKKGVLASGMPAFDYLGDAEIARLVAYLRELQGVVGSEERHPAGHNADGEKLFFAEHSCSSCHMIKGRGGFLGADLSAYARGRSTEDLRASILHPQNIPGNLDHIVGVRTKEGGSFRGLIRTRDNFTIVLQSEDGAYHSIVRDQIQSLSVDSQPLMPQDYSKRLDEKQINALINYLFEVSASASSQLPVDKED
jgi:cytochrome c oxidase cbb3-type subunit 3